MKFLTVAAGILMLIVFSGSAKSAENEKPSVEPAPAQAQECVYVGVKKCAFCHVRLDNSLKTWAITKHANALAALRTEEARKYSDTPDEDPKCLKCHMTGMSSDSASLEERAVRVRCDHHQ